jgi:hypothetical protein
MPQYQLRFAIPQQRHGERETYKAFAVTLRKLHRLVGKEPSGTGTVIRNVEVSGGSVRGRADIEAKSYRDALEICTTRPAGTPSAPRVSRGPGRLPSRAAGWR